MNEPLLIIHGGMDRAGDQQGSLPEACDRELRRVAAAGWKFLASHDARETTAHVMRLLEDADVLNPGAGCAGVSRSAAVMDGERKRFSAVIHVEGTRYPSELACRLQDEPHTVLAGDSALAYAREEDLEPGDSRVASAPEASPGPGDDEADAAGPRGICGAVVLDREGRICAATSASVGQGQDNVPGRVGDSPTVAGTFANGLCGVSCTGIGEHIINEAVAAAVATRVSDGLSVGAAVRRSLVRGNEKGYQYGLIALSRGGKIAVGETRGMRVRYACHSVEGLRSFLEE